MGSATFQDIPCSTRELTRSASMPDINDIFIHEIVGTILSSWGSNRRSSFLDKSHKSESPMSLSVKVLKAQLFQLKNRLRTLESENHCLKLSNKALESEVRTINHELSNLRSDYSCSIAEREKLARASKQDRQKIRTLVSDVDKAQDFIMAMTDIKLHEFFLHDAATSTIENGQDAELALIKAIAQAADTKGSVWSRIIPFIAGVRCTDTYVSAIDFALQDKSTFRGQKKRSEVQTCNAASEACISPGSHDRCPNVLLANGYTHHLLPFRGVEMAAIPSVSTRNLVDNFASQRIVELPPSIVNLEVRRSLSHPTKSSNFARPSSVNVGTTERTANAKQPLLLDSASSISSRSIIASRTSSETSTQAPEMFGKDNISGLSGGLSHSKADSNSGRSSNVDKRKGLIVIEDAESRTARIALDIKSEKRASISKDLWVVGTGHSNLELDTVLSIGKGTPKTDIESGNNVALPSAVSAGSSGLCLTALESLERICATLSNSDLGSLEMTTDDDQSQSEVDIGHPSETESDDLKTHTRSSTTPITNEMIKTQRGSFLDAMSSLFNSDLILGSVAPRSTIPTSFPLVARADAELSASEMLIEVPPSPPVNPNWRTEQQLNQERPANLRTNFSSRSSLHLSKLPVVTGIARRIGRAVHTPLSSQQSSRRQSGSLNASDSPSFHGSVAPPSENSTLMSTISKSHRDATRQKTVRTCAPTSSVPAKRQSRDSLSRHSMMSTAPKGSSSVTAANKKPSVSKTCPVPLLEPLKASVHALKQVQGAVNSVSKPQPRPPISGDSKTSSGKGILRRLSNIPASASKSRPSIVSAAASPRLIETPLQVKSRLPSGKPQTPSSQNVTSVSSLLSAPNAQTPAAASGIDPISTPPKISIARHAKTKLRSNTNNYSPMKSSPLSQNVVIVSADLESDSTALNGEKSAPPLTSGHASTLRITGDKSLPLLSPARFMSKSAVLKAQVKKNPNTSTAVAKLDVSSPPTAAFMKPVDRLPMNATKRMTNSMKPLIPTWTPGMSTPAQCRRMFRNSLSMVVR